MIENPVERRIEENAADNHNEDCHSEGDDIFHSAEPERIFFGRSLVRNAEPDRGTRIAEHVAEVVYAVAQNAYAVGVNPHEQF